MDTVDRFEFKFLLDQAKCDSLFDAYGPCLQPDTLGGPDGVYPVVSLYYDTPELDCYWDAWRRVPSRRKLRVRVYGSKDGTIPATCFLEVKCKVDGRGIKHRLQTDLSSALALANGGPFPQSIPARDRTVLNQVRQLVVDEHFVPRCVIRYRRRALFMSNLPGGVSPLEEPLRITLDEELQCRFEEFLPEPDDSRFSCELLPKGRRVMEIKGAGAVPYPLSVFLGRMGIQPTGFSKYCHAMGRVANA